MPWSVAARKLQSASSGPILIVAALEEELAAVRRSTSVARRLRIGGCPVALGRLAGVPVALARTGDGAARAARGVAAVLDRVPAGRMILIGLAGGLTPQLEAGRLLAARDVVDAAGTAPPPDPLWLSRALAVTGAHPSTFVSCREILCTAEAKARTRAGLPAGSSAAADLESAAFARAAAQRGIPYVALRAVSDTAEEALPLDFNALRDEGGGVDRRRVALRALLRPALIPPLWRLRGRAALCSETLARAVRALLAGGA